MSELIVMNLDDQIHYGLTSDPPKVVLGQNGKVALQ